MKKIQSKNHRIGTFSKFSLSSFDGKIYILDNGIDALGLGY